MPRVRFCYELFEAHPRLYQQLHHGDDSRLNLPLRQLTMASVKGSASYKKKDGSLLLLKDAVTWTPAAPPGAPASLSIPIPTITSESLVELSHVFKKSC